MQPKIKPVVFDDPNEVMGKSNIIYYEDPEVARKTPTRSIALLVILQLNLMMEDQLYISKNA